MLRTFGVQVGLTNRTDNVVGPQSIMALQLDPVGVDMREALYRGLLARATHDANLQSQPGRPEQKPETCLALCFLALATANTSIQKGNCHMTTVGSPPKVCGILIYPLHIISRLRAHTSYSTTAGKKRVQQGPILGA